LVSELVIAGLLETEVALLDTGTVLDAGPQLNPILLTLMEQLDFPAPGDPGV